MRISKFGNQELACAVLGLDYFTLCVEGRENEIGEKIRDRFEIDFEQFVDVVRALLPFTPFVWSWLSGVKYHAFVNYDKGLIFLEQKVEGDDE